MKRTISITTDHKEIQMIKKKNGLTIKKKLIAGFAAITLIPIVILSCFLLLNIRESAFNSFVSSTDRELVQIDNAINFFLERY